MDKPKFFGYATLGNGNHVSLSAEQAEVIWLEVERHKNEIATRLPDESAALRAMVEAFHRLKDFGWREAEYCPKDGSSFQAIEAGSTGIHTAHYHGEWPRGSWWIEAEGDIWPSKPVLFRLFPEDERKLRERLEIAAKEYAALDNPT